MRDTFGLEYAYFTLWHVAGSLGQAKLLGASTCTSHSYTSAALSAGSPFDMQSKDHRLEFFNYLHLGSPKYWVIGASNECKHLEKCLWGSVRALWEAHWKRPRCSPFARHLGV